MSADFVSIPTRDAQARIVAGADGTELRLYRLQGGRRDGPPLLLGHCNGFSAGCYLPLLRALAADHDVFAFDHRGHGGSGAFIAEAGAPLADLVASDVAILVDAVTRERPGSPIHYVGHSLSAAALLHLALQVPARFCALPLAQAILIEPPVFPDQDHPLFAECTASTVELLARTRRRRRRWESPAAYAAALRGRGPFAAFAPGMLDQVAIATLEAREGAFVLACAPETEAAIFATWGRPILFPGLAKIPAAIPMILVGGDPEAPGRDWVTAMMPSVAGRIAHLVFETMPGHGHLWPFEAPDDAVSFLAARIASNLRAKCTKA
jgi:pimeloyl-ACP methyl ester carboxylesterase